MDSSDIYGIFFECPTADRCADCVVNQVIHLSHHDRIKWFERLDENRKIEITNRHMSCTRSRK